MRASLIPLALTGLVLLPRPSRAQTPTPAAPKGYSWQQCKGMKGQFLVPTGWHFKEENREGTSACFISLEEILPGREFKTGVSIELLRNIPGKTGIGPTEFSRRYVEKAGKEHKLIESSSRSSGLFFVRRIEYVSKAPGLADVHLWNLLIANEKTGSLILVIAESPEETWKLRWPTMEPILAKLGLDDEE